jgi:hypothetical protein
MIGLEVFGRTPAMIAVAERLHELDGTASSTPARS